MGIYVCNFVFLSYQNKKSLPPYLLPIILTILMVIVIYFCQKISIIGLTGFLMKLTRKIIYLSNKKSLKFKI